jgi:DNA-binding Lrp family transcriptional regulator
MLSAYVLIETEVGKVAHVAQVIAKVQAPSLDELGRLVASQIQLQDGVTRTVTCIVLHR